MAGYYDVVLGLIPITVAGVAGVLVALGVGASLAVSVGSALSVPLLVHAMFVRAPVAPSPDPSAGRSAPGPSFNAAD